MSVRSIKVKQDTRILAWKGDKRSIETQDAKGMTDLDFTERATSHAVEGDIADLD